MNKRLKFCISILLIVALIVGCCSVPVASFENDVVTSTEDMLLINTDTNTVVFSQKPDNKWYLGTLSELMTLLVAYDSISDPENTVVTVRQSFIDGLPYSDGCLNDFVGQKLSAKDLMAIMLLTSGSDAAYALADIAGDRDRDAFVASMNERAAGMGMKNTNFVSPGFSKDSAHHTTCRDLYKLYMEVRKNPIHSEVMEEKTYVPAGYDAEKFTVKAAPSILNENSPYYFRYTNDAQYYYSDDTYAGIVLTTTYRGMSYFYAGLLGLNESEKNVYADARKLTTWAYLNLSDRKMINADEKMSGTVVKTDWGEYMVDLHPFNSAFKTLPNEYEEEKLSYTFDIPKSAKTPLTSGQSIGKATMYYDGEEIDEIGLIIQTDEGLSMLSDFQRFTGYVYTKLIPRSMVVSSPVDVDATQPPSKKETATESKSSEETSAEETKPAQKIAATEAAASEAPAVTATQR